MGPVITATRLAGVDGRGDLLIVGAGLGTRSETLWGRAANLLGDDFEVIGVDLPGHGRSPATSGAFAVPELAAQVRQLAAEIGAGRKNWYAGVSLAGAVAFELGLKPGPFSGVAAIAAASRFGEPEAWEERAALVRKAGTSVMVAGSSRRWFAPGFVERQGQLVGQMLHDLADTDDESYALCCEALATYDVRSALGEMDVPFLLGPGSEDVVITPERAAEDLVTLAHQRAHTFDGCGHQPPAEDPAAVAAVLTTFINEAGRPAQEAR